MLSQKLSLLGRRRPSPHINASFLHLHLYNSSSSSSSTSTSNNTSSSLESLLLSGRRGYGSTNSKHSTSLLSQSSSPSGRLATSLTTRSRSSARKLPLGRQGQTIPLHISDLPQQQQHSPQPYHDSYHNTNFATANNDTHSSSSSPAQQPHSQQFNETNKYESDLIVVLDMDECLLHSTFHDTDDNTSNNNNDYAHQVLDRNSQQQQLNTNGVETMQVRLDDDDSSSTTIVTVHLRPHVRQFLKFCVSHFETHIFTAALPIYANPVLDGLLVSSGMMCNSNANEPTFGLAGRWFRDSCQHYPASSSVGGGLGAAGIYSKRLQNILQPSPLADNSASSSPGHHQEEEEHDLSRVVLVDNNPLSFVDNPDNGILVNNFYHDGNDTTLPAVQALLQELDAIKSDVRPHLRRQFGLQRALQQHLNTTNSGNSAANNSILNGNSAANTTVTAASSTSLPNYVHRQ